MYDQFANCLSVLSQRLRLSLLLAYRLHLRLGELRCCGERKKADCIAGLSRLVVSKNQGSLIVEESADSKLRVFKS